MRFDGRFSRLGSAPRAAWRGPGGQGGPQGQLNSRFTGSGLEVGKAFPAVDVHDATGKPFNTASLKGFHTVVVSGCLT